MASFAGLRGTDDWGTDERPKNFRELILWSSPNGNAPLFALSSRMKKETTDDPEFSWWEETNQPIRLQLNDGTNMTAVDTTVVVDNALDTNNSGEYDATILRPGDVLQVEPATQPAVYDGTTVEMVVVDSVTSATQFEVVRGFAGTTAATINDDAWFTKVGTAFAEGTGAPDTGSGNPTKFYNLTQIFKKAFDETGTAGETNTRTGNSWNNDKMRNAFQHSASIEQAFFWGIRSEATDATNGKPIRTMAGLASLITSHRSILAGGTATLDSLIDATNPVFNYEDNGAGSERIAYCGNGFLNYLNKKVAEESSVRMNYDGVLNMWGQTLQKYTTPQGTIAFRSHPLFNVHPEYTYSAFVLNPKGLVYRPLRNRDTKFKDNIQANDEDTRKAQWLTECSLEIHFERSFAYIGNFGG